MQDVEFTVQEGKLYMLQCRNGKRNGAAAVTIACDFVDEGLVPIPEAIMMVEPRHLDQLLLPRFVSQLPYTYDILGVGVGVSPGAAGAHSCYFPEIVNFQRSTQIIS
jgi:pyruvate, orthophosphate dikinase